MAVRCPVCGLGDAVQNLSVVLAVGESSSSLSGPLVGAGFAGGLGVGAGFMSLSGSARTRLAGTLAAPAAPVREPGKRGTIVSGLITLAVIGCGLLSTMWFVLGVGALVFDAATRVVVAVVGVVSGLLVLGAAAWLVAYWRRDSARRNQEYAAAYQAWEAALRKWKGAYFCFRDGVVFDPSTDEVCATEHMSSFLYG